MILKLIQRILLTPNHLIPLKIIFSKGGNPLIKTFLEYTLMACFDVQEFHQGVVNKWLLDVLIYCVTLKPTIE